MPKSQLYVATPREAAHARLSKLRTGRVAALMLAGVALVSLALVLVALAVLREDQLLAGERDIQTKTRLTGEMISSSLLAADLGMQLMIEEMRGSAPLLQRAQPWVQQRMVARLASLPQLRSLWVLDGSGRIIFESASGNIGVDFSDRDYFTAHRDGRVPGLFFGRGVHSRISGDWFVPLSREVRDEAGGLQAVLVAAIDTRYFTGLWGEVDVGEDGSISLLSDDGTLLMRSPAKEELLGKSFAKGRVVSAMLRESSGFAYRARSGIDGVERIFSLDRVAKYPRIVVVVGASVDRILENWRRSAVVALIAWFGGTLALAFLWWVLLRGLRDRQRAEAQLDSLARLAEEDPNPILRVDAGGTVLYANPAAERLRTAISGHGKDAVTAWEAFVARATRAEAATTLETNLDGAAYSLTMAPVQAQGYVNVYATEITSRKRGEERLRAQLARTELLTRITRAIGDRLELESVLQVVTDSVHSQLPASLCVAALGEDSLQRLVVRCIGTGGADVANESGLGLGRALPGEDADHQRYAPGAPLYRPELRDTDDELARSLLKAGMRSAVMAPLQVEGRMFGLLLVARVSPGAFVAEEIDFLGQLGQHAALAAQQAQLHATLRQAYDELMGSQRAMLRQEGLRALGQMAGAIAHDINNALSPVALYTESLLADEAQMSKRATEYLSRIQRAVDDVTGTVERLREFHRPIDDATKRMQVDINALAREVAELAAQKFLGSTLRIELHLQEQMPALDLLHAEIREALLNLLNNASDAMPGGGTIVIRTCTAQGTDGSQQAWVEVTDSGIGMNEVIARRCLEPFFTTKGDRGTGLGLAMVYGAMQRHSGDIEINSRPGLGTTIRLIFPMSVVPAIAPLAGAGALRSNLRILLVDDDAAVLSSLERMLEFDGHDVETAAGGRAGIDAFERSLGEGRPYQIVITDLGMQDLDGIGTAEAIKALSPDTRVILLTGWGEAVSDVARATGTIDQVLGKPLRLTQMRLAIEGFVREGNTRPRAGGAP